jgi:hypothetical protein
MSKEIFDDFNKLMENAQIDPNLSPDDQTLLSKKHKKIIEYIQGSWKELISDEKNRSTVSKKEFQLQYIKICTEIISKIDFFYQDFDMSHESKVLYYKMKGDYYTCLAEIENNDDLKNKYRVTATICYDEELKEQKILDDNANLDDNATN